MSRTYTSDSIVAHAFVVQERAFYAAIPFALVFIVRRMVTIARRESDDRMGVGSGRNRTADGLLTAYPNAAAAGGDD